MNSGDGGGKPEQSGGPPAERLRETLERELGEVPPESPSEPAEEAKREGKAKREGSEPDEQEQGEGEGGRP